MSCYKCICWSRRKCEDCLCEIPKPIGRYIFHVLSKWHDLILWLVLIGLLIWFIVTYHEFVASLCSYYWLCPGCKYAQPDDYVVRPNTTAWWLLFNNSLIQ